MTDKSYISINTLEEDSSTQEKSRNVNRSCTFVNTCSSTSTSHSSQTEIEEELEKYKYIKLEKVLPSKETLVLKEPPIIASKLRELLEPFVVTLSSEHEKDIISNRKEENNKQVDECHNVADINTAEERQEQEIKEEHEEKITTEELQEQYTSNSIEFCENGVYDTPELRHHADRLFLRILGSEVKKNLSINSEFNKTQQLMSSESSCISHYESSELSLNYDDDNNNNNNNDDKNKNQNNIIGFKIDCINKEEHQSLLLQAKSALTNVCTWCRSVENKRVDVNTGEEYWTTVIEVDELDHMDDRDTSSKWTTNIATAIETSSAICNTRNFKEQWEKKLHNPLCDDDMESKEVDQIILWPDNMCTEEANSVNNNNDNNVFVQLWRPYRKECNVKENVNVSKEAKEAYTLPTFPLLLPSIEHDSDTNVQPSSQHFFMNDNNNNALVTINNNKYVKESSVECKPNANEVSSTIWHKSLHDSNATQLCQMPESRSSSNSLSAVSERSLMESDVNIEEEVKSINVCNENVPIIYDRTIHINNTRCLFNEEDSNNNKNNINVDVSNVNSEKKDNKGCIVNLHNINGCVNSVNELNVVCVCNDHHHSNHHSNNDNNIYNSAGRKARLVRNDKSHHWSSPLDPDEDVKEMSMEIVEDWESELYDDVIEEL